MRQIVGFLLIFLIFHVIAVEADYCEDGRVYDVNDDKFYDSPSKTTKCRCEIIYPVHSGNDVGYLIIG
uniref:Uncharacterized protein n=1 Tax=Panagrolaimus sp. JU765 TaxID=591449 RepID=A0AC34R5M0_9BILA